MCESLQTDTYLFCFARRVCTLTGVANAYIGDLFIAAVTCHRLIPLCGTVSVEYGSRVVRTTCDLRNVLNGGDWLHIGAQTAVVTSPFTADRLTLMTQFSGPSATGLKAFKQSRDVPLSGTISVTEGSTTLTTSSDLRAEIAPGDLIRIFQVRCFWWWLVRSLFLNLDMTYSCGRPATRRYPGAPISLRSSYHRTCIHSRSQFHIPGLQPTG